MPADEKTKLSNVNNSGKSTSKSTSANASSSSSVDESENLCNICGKGGVVLICEIPKCGKVYHPFCIGRMPEESEPFHCPVHFCSLCSEKGVEAGGTQVLLSCGSCTTSYCERHVPVSSKYEELRTIEDSRKNLSSQFLNSLTTEAVSGQLSMGNNQILSSNSNRAISNSSQRADACPPTGTSSTNSLSNSTDQSIGIDNSSSLMSDKADSSAIHEQKNEFSPSVSSPFSLSNSTDALKGSDSLSHVGTGVVGESGLVSSRNTSLPVDNSGKMGSSGSHPSENLNTGLSTTVPNAKRRRDADDIPVVDSKEARQAKRLANMLKNLQSDLSVKVTEPSVIQSPTTSQSQGPSIVPSNTRRTGRNTGYLCPCCENGLARMRLSRTLELVVSRAIANNAMTEDSGRTVNVQFDCLFAPPLTHRSVINSPGLSEAELLILAGVPRLSLFLTGDVGVIADWKIPPVVERFFQTRAVAWLLEFFDRVEISKSDLRRLSIDAPNDESTSSQNESTGSSTLSQFAVNVDPYTLTAALATPLEFSLCSAIPTNLSDFLRIIRSGKYTTLKQAADDLGNMAKFVGIFTGAKVVRPRVGSTTVAEPSTSPVMDSSKLLENSIKYPNPSITVGNEALYGVPLDVVDLQCGFILPALPVLGRSYSPAAKASAALAPALRGAAVSADPEHHTNGLRSPREALSRAADTVVDILERAVLFGSHLGTCRRLEGVLPGVGAGIERAIHECVTVPRLNAKSMGYQQIFDSSLFSSSVKNHSNAIKEEPSSPAPATSSSVLGSANNNDMKSTPSTSAFSQSPSSLRGEETPSKYLYAGPNPLFGESIQPFGFPDELGLLITALTAYRSYDSELPRWGEQLLQISALLSHLDRNPADSQLTEVLLQSNLNHSIPNYGEEASVPSGGNMDKSVILRSLRQAVADVANDQPMFATVSKAVNGPSSLLSLLQPALQLKKGPHWTKGLLALFSLTDEAACVRLRALKLSGSRPEFSSVGPVYPSTPAKLPASASFLPFVAAFGSPNYKIIEPVESDSDDDTSSTGNDAKGSKNAKSTSSAAAKGKSSSGVKKAEPTEVDYSQLYEVVDEMLDEMNPFQRLRVEHWSPLLQCPSVKVKNKGKNVQAAVQLAVSTRRKPILTQGKQREAREQRSLAMLEMSHVPLPEDEGHANVNVNSNKEGDSESNQRTYRSMEKRLRDEKALSKSIFYKSFQNRLDSKLRDLDSTYHAIRQRFNVLDTPNRSTSGSSTQIGASPNRGKVVVSERIQRSLNPNGDIQYISSYGTPSRAPRSVSDSSGGNDQNSNVSALEGLGKGPRVTGAFDHTFSEFFVNKVKPVVFEESKKARKSSSNNNDNLIVSFEGNGAPSGSDLKPDSFYDRTSKFSPNELKYYEKLSSSVKSTNFNDAPPSTSEPNVSTSSREKRVKTERVGSTASSAPNDTLSLLELLEPPKSQSNLAVATNLAGIAARNAPARAPVPAVSYSSSPPVDFTDDSSNAVLRLLQNMEQRANRQDQLLSSLVHSVNRLEQRLNGLDSGQSPSIVIRPSGTDSAPMDGSQGPSARKAYCEGDLYVPRDTTSLLREMTLRERRTALVLTEMGPLETDKDLLNLADFLPRSESEINQLFDSLSTNLRRALTTQAELRAAWSDSRRAMFALPHQVFGEDRDEGVCEPVVTLGDGKVAMEFAVANRALRAHVLQLESALQVKK